MFGPVVGQRRAGRAATRIDLFLQQLDHLLDSLGILSGQIAVFVQVISQIEQLHELRVGQVSL